METKWFKWFGIIFLIIALLGLIMIYIESVKSDNLLVKVQLGSILYLALLSLGLFYENHKNKMVTYFHRPWIGKLGLVFVAAFVVDLVWTEYVYWLVANTLNIPLICTACLAVGLYLSGQAIIRS